MVWGPKGKVKVGKKNRALEGVDSVDSSFENANNIAGRGAKPAAARGSYANRSMAF